MTVFDTSGKVKKSHIEKDMFLDDDGGVDIARYDIVRYKFFLDLLERQQEFFWTPHEIDVTKDGTDFKHELSEHEQHIFTSNLKRQILLDSVQGRAPVEAFAPVISLPEAEAWILNWSFSEMIHSASYTHLLRAVFADPSVIFDEIMDIEEIVNCAKDISRDYDALIDYSKWYSLLGPGKHKINGKEMEISKYQLKVLIYRALCAVSCLEGIRFFSSFVTSWLPAETRKVMEGSAKIIKFICRDENLHLAGTQIMIRQLIKDDSDFAQIAEQEEEYVTKIFVDATEQEMEWARYLFAHGTVVGLNVEMLCEYLRWIANKRMRALKLKSPYEAPQKNPLPWTEKWIAGQETQVAPQEVELSSYVIGGTKQDLEKSTFSGFQL